MKFIQHEIFKVVAMIYKIEKKRRKSVTSPPCNSERSKEPLADLKDEKQVQKDKFKNIPAPSSLNNKYTLNKIQQQEENDTEAPIEDIEDEKQIQDNHNNPVSALSVPCSKYTLNKIQQQEENDTEQLEDLRELSAGFRQNQDEASRRFKSKTSGSMHYHLDSYINQVAPVASKEERSSHKERETLNIPVPTENQLTSMDGNMEEEVVITTEGGLIEILGTGVSLEIPPGALEEEQLIKMRIVSDDYQDELSRSFGSNSSVVVELLPSNLKLLKPAKLTLPHCLVLKKGCEWKAKIYTSHHEEGNQPFWEEDPFASSKLHQNYCEIWLQHLGWEKFQVGNKTVEGKKIILYAARRVPSPNSDAYVDVGFYLDLPGGQQAVDLKNEDILGKQHVVFHNKDELPLTISFEDSSSIWTCSPEEANPKEIAFQRVATSSSCHSTFVLKEQTNLEITDYSCNFKAGQGTDLIDLIFPLQIWRPPISKFASDVKTANIKQPPAAEETMETSSSAETTKVAPVALKEERLSDKEKAILNIPVPTGSMENEEAITTEGGFIEIEGTGVSLIIPPGAFEEEQLIKMRIVLDDYQDELSRSFGSNSSVVVELLPSNLKLQKQAKLTLPHCLVLEKGCEWKAEIYTSHHEEGNQPFWEEDPFASSELHEKYCVIWLQHFSWWKSIFGIKKKVKGKRIILYAARRNPSPNSDAYVDVGFYLDLPGGQQAVDLKNEDILRKQHVVFHNKDELPLTILFKDLPSIWTCSPEEENPKQISFGIVAEWKGCYSTFVLKVQENSEIKGYSCYFKAGQGTNLVDLKFPLEIWRPPISKFASGVKTADIKQPPAAEETMETSSSAEATKIPSNLCSTHLSISRGELTSGPPLDFPATSTCYKCIALLKYVAQHIVETWKDVGRNLKLAESCIQRIKIDHQLCSEQSFQMLMKWIDEYGSGANFMVLGKALEEDKNLLLKQQLEQRIKDEHI